MKIRENLISRWSSYDEIVKAFYVLHISTYVNDMLLLFPFKQQQSIVLKKKNTNQYSHLSE